MTHEVSVICNCDNIELCLTEVYVSDIRILLAELLECVDGQPAGGVA